MYTDYILHCGLYGGLVGVSKAGVGADEVEHCRYQLGEIVIVFPAPVVAGVAVIKVHRPAVSNGLPDVVDVVGDLEVWYLLLDLSCQLLRGEAHGVDVVGAHAELLRRGLHHLQRGSQAVVNVHHGQACAWLQVALKFPILAGIMEDGHGIVSCAASWLGVSRDDARVPQTTEIQAIPVVVVLSHELGVHLGDTVDRARPLHTQIRSGVTWGGGAEGSDGAGDEQTQSVFSGNIQNIV